MSNHTAEFDAMDETLRVLIVEDEPRLRELLLHALPDMGFTGDAAKSGEEAVKVMEKQPHQVIVLDLNLPGMSGLEFFAIVREKWPRTQVVILTGFGDLETARHAIKLDVADFLTKPCPLGDLETALDHARKRIKEPPRQKPALAAAAEAEAMDDTPLPSAEDRGSATLREIERDHILAALKRNTGNRNATADELGISVRTLYYRLNEYQKEGYEV
ncbi:MAG: response regulator [Phycisphaeraceae bacterium]